MAVIPRTSHLHRHILTFLQIIQDGFDGCLHALARAPTRLRLKDLSQPVGSGVVDCFGYIEPAVEPLMVGSPKHQHYFPSVMGGPGDAHLRAVLEEGLRVNEEGLMS